jgi:hypothetical protein
MDPTVVSLVAIFSPAVAALFAAYTWAMKQSREDWKQLFLEERKDHKETREKASDNSAKNSAAYEKLADFIEDLPRRRGDWDQISVRDRR